MLIAIDARMLADRLHGLARLVYAMTDAMARLAPSDRFVLLSASPYAAELARAHSNVGVVATKYRPFHPLEHVEIPALLWRLRPDLLHVVSAALPLWLPTPFVVTIPDLIPLAHASSGGRLHRLYFQHYLPWRASRARRILTFSEAVRRDLAERLGVPADPVAVVPLGVESRFSPLPDRPDETGEAREVAGQLGLERPYLLTIGNPRPHKNLPLAIEAFEHLAQAHRIPADLDLAVVSTRAPALEERVARSPLRERIKRLPWVEESLLPALYRQARAFFLPSRYEGFGLPLLEAMACGCVCVTSTATSLAEVAGNGALGVDPDDFDGVLEALVLALTDETVRAGKRRKGIEQAARFTWDACARSTLEVYRQALGRSG